MQAWYTAEMYYRISAQTTASVASDTGDASVTLLCGMTGPWNKLRFKMHYLDLSLGLFM